MKKRFSVVIATYNREQYLKEAINSVLSQAFTNFETIIVDDGSTDHTAELIKSYEKPIKYILQHNQGPEVAHNRGYIEATGEYIAFLDDDDFFFPWTLAVYDRIITELNSPPLIIGSSYNGQNCQGNLNYTNAIIGRKFRDYLSKNIGMSVSGSKIIVQKSILDEIGETTNQQNENQFLL